MRKIRLYLETSPIIMIGPDQDPIRQAITREFFRIVAERADEYELFVSPMTIQELENETSMSVLKTFDYTKLSQDTEAENLAWIYVQEEVLTQTHIADLMHVAYAVFSRCDYIITWNMKHLANERTVRRVNAVNATENYGKIYIATPEFFTGGQIYGR